MSKIISVLCILVVLPLFNPVLCEDDSWQSFLEKSKETPDVAVGDGSGQQGANGANDGSSLADWVRIQVPRRWLSWSIKGYPREDASIGSPGPAEAPVDITFDDEDGSIGEPPVNSPAMSPGGEESDELSPLSALIRGPAKAPAAGPTARAPFAATPY